tara:strand:- start:468 stop:1415 length:948 start_codon:yes stop_codon:yes gene_type:complete
MNIESMIQPLFDEDVALEEKVKLITALNAKMYDAETLYELAHFFIEKSVRISNPYPDSIDVVGTGGDGAKTLNYSTLSALVAHHYGLPVVKHGNKAITSQCGSFDFLGQLAIEIPETAEAANQILADEKLVFLFAPFFHPIFKPVAEARKVFADRGEKTIFNVLGPLLLPDGVKRVVVGVYDVELVEPMAEALVKLGVEYGYVVYGSGLDEFSVCGVNTIMQIKNGQLHKQTLHPEQLGFIRSQIPALAAGDAYQNFEESKKILCGEVLGPKADMLILNAAAAIHVGKGFDKPLAFYIDEVKQLLEKGICLNPQK